MELIGTGFNYMNQKGKHNMSQGKINQAQWEHADNWSGPKWLCMYFSKKDSRTIVPKKIKAMGWTINFGSPSGVYWFVGSIILPLLLAIAIVIISKS